MDELVEKQIEWLRGHTHDCSDYSNCVRCGAAETIERLQTESDKWAAIRESHAIVPLDDLIRASAWMGDSPAEIELSDKFERLTTARQE